MTGWLLIRSLQVGGALCLLVPMAGADDTREQRVRKELERTRTSLHQAQVELGRKAERIRKLERRLEQAGIPLPPGKPARDRPDMPLDDVGKSAAGEKNASKEPAPAEPRKAEPRKAEPRKAEPRKAMPEPAEAKDTPEPFRVVMPFDSRSAVNYEARQEALEKLRDYLEQSPGARFRLDGGADDTEYETANRDIAENRVRFLLAYFAANGLPEDRFEIGKLVSTTTRSGPKRFVEITEK